MRFADEDLEQPRRPCDRFAGGIFNYGQDGQCGGLGGARGKELLRLGISSRSESHRPRHGNAAEFYFFGVWREKELEPFGIYRRDGGCDPQTGGRCTSHLRVERRSGFGGGGGAEVGRAS